MSLYRAVARPVLFRLGGGDAEGAHEWTLRRLSALSRRPAALAALRVLRRYADYVAVNVSSPNTPGLRSLQDRPALAALLAALRAEAGDTPVLVKVAPDLTDHALGELLDVCVTHGVAGLIATNTTPSRDGLVPADAARAAQPAGLSGRPLTGRAPARAHPIAK